MHACFFFVLSPSNYAIALVVSEIPYLFFLRLLDLFLQQIKREERKRARHQHTETEATSSNDVKMRKLEQATNTVTSASVSSTALDVMTHQQKMVTCQQQLIERLEKENALLREEVESYRRRRPRSKTCVIL